MQTRIAPGLDGWIAAEEQRRAAEQHGLRQNLGNLQLQGMLQDQELHPLKVQQIRDEIAAKSEQRRAILQFAASLPEEERFRFLANPQEYFKELRARPQQQATAKLAGLLSTGNYTGPTPASVEMNEAAALDKFGVRQNPDGTYTQVGPAPTEGMNVVVPNPGLVQSLAVQADPARAIPKILEQQKPPPQMTEYQQRYLDIQQQRADQGANRPGPAPSFVVTQDPNSPTGWSHRNTRTNELSPGAPPPASAAPKPPRPMPAPLQKQLTEASELVDATERFVTSFKDNYGGKTFTGDLGNQWGKIFGDDTGQAQWWQDYELHQSQIRNKLFGSALTASEIEAWNKSAINPRMNSGEIRKNLTRRETIERKGYAKLTNFAERSGFPKDQIEALTGRPVGGASSPAAQSVLDAADAILNKGK